MKGQSRFEIPLEELPEEIAELVSGRSFRSGVMTERTGECEIEAAFEPGCKTLIIWCDQGPKQWGSLCYLTYSLQLRCLPLLDVFHRRDDNMKLAIRQGGLSPVRACALVCMNLMAGPWGENSNYSRLRDAFYQWFQTHSSADPLFALAYASIAEEKHQGRMPANAGSQEHMQETYAWALENAPFDGRGPVVKAARWHNYAFRSSFLKNKSSLVVFASVILGLADNVYKSIYDTPYGGRTWAALSQEGARKIKIKMSVQPTPKIVP
eukprot:6492597-Amphidinium_carterae.3